MTARYPLVINGTSIQEIQPGDTYNLGVPETLTLTNATGLPLTSGVTGSLPIANGGTGQTTQSAAFNALSPITTTGDLIIGNDSNSATRLGIGTNGQVLTSNGTTATWANTQTLADVRTPLNVSPPNATTKLGLEPVLTGSTYYNLYGIAMSASQWQVSTTSNFSTTIINSGDRAGTSLSYSVAPGILSSNTTYYWRVRYKDANGSYSNWSEATTFSTEGVIAPTVIGAAVGGGYYAGKINQGGTEYYLIVSPKASGEVQYARFKTSQTTTAGTFSDVDGPTNSANMNTSVHEIAYFCNALVIGGYTDWYMPAKNELEVLYYNLKPFASSNVTSSGINANAVPSRGSNYTSLVPAQTSVDIFKSGGSEALDAGSYWSSTPADSTFAWEQDFFDGTQRTNYKNDQRMGRAIRRVAV